MKKLLSVSLILLVTSCTVNVYDYSTHSGGGTLEPDPPSSPSEPDTTVTRRALPGTGGVVIMENCGTWTRYTLKGCFIETDGVAMETSPVLVRTESGDGAESSLFQIAFTLRIQHHMIDSEQGDVFPESQPSETVLPVVTGTRLLSLMVDRTSLPFLIEEAEIFETERLPGGTISCNAVFTVEEWEMRIICTGDQITAVSEYPEYRLLFGENERRMLQQFYDVFVIHNGDAPVLPVQEGRDDIAI